MRYIRSFEQLGSDDVHIAGGKGASLGEILRMGISVPAGFVILAPAFRRFLTEANLDTKISTELRAVNHKEIHAVRKTSAKIRRMILSTSVPSDVITEIKKYFKKLNVPRVAIRSSATSEDSAGASWAGQLDTYLNTPEERLLNNVKRCWSSLFTTRAIVYRFERGLHKHKISVAVVVQHMINSDIAGVAFSGHPVTKNKNHLIIEAGFGLGEAIVSGQITPDTYVVKKKPRRIINKAIATQTRSLVRRNSSEGGNKWVRIPKLQGSSQTLTDEQIHELTELVLKIESHYGFSCDIEWANENGVFYILQSRPITTLKREKTRQSNEIVEIVE